MSAASSFIILKVFAVAHIAHIGVKGSHATAAASFSFRAVSYSIVKDVFIFGAVVVDSQA